MLSLIQLARFLRKASISNWRADLILPEWIRYHTVEQEVFASEKAARGR
jgi:hypothetical protein